jgi:hydroxyacylglutathione hydrolase
VKEPRVQYLATGRWHTNCWLIIGKANAAIVIDPGDDQEGIVRALEDVGASPKALLATHGHHDHIGAASSLMNHYAIPLYMHEADIRLARSLNLYRKMFDKLPPVQAPVPTGFLKDRDILDLFGCRLEVMHIPGHTRGSIAFRLNNSLFSGDTLLENTCGRLDLPGADPVAMRESLRRLRDLPENMRLLPGHGRESTLAAALSTCLEDRKR